MSLASDFNAEFPEVTILKEESDRLVITFPKTSTNERIVELAKYLFDLGWKFSRVEEDFSVVLVPVG